jgi:hypothetical protein
MLAETINLYLWIQHFNTFPCGQSVPILADSVPIPMDTVTSVPILDDTVYSYHLCGYNLQLPVDTLYSFLQYSVLILADTL